MTDNVERATLDVEAPAEEDVSIRNKLPRNIIFILGLPAICFIIYVIVSLVLNSGSLEVAKADIQNEYVNIEIINNNIVLLDANINLPVNLEKKGNIDPSPDLGTFNLTISVIQHHPIVSFSTSQFQISKNKQLLVLKFDAYETHLPEGEMLLFQKWLQEGKIWLKLTGDFKWHVKLRILQLIKGTEMHTHFSCDMPYKDTTHLGICNW